MACSCSHGNIPPLFSVYARMEDLNEDSLYFFLKSGLLSRVNFTQKLNSAHAAESTEERQVCKDGVYFQNLLHCFEAPSQVLESGVPWPDSSAGPALGIPGRLRDVQLQRGSLPPHHWLQQTRYITRKIVSLLLCF